ncbi:MAG: NAD-dependent succinate-semialdehyde dehydrogenase [Myxococcales bacterium]|nr:NAD-dependent succinate-semialdehyde dehydrogenase [Myxococcales bacterium]
MTHELDIPAERYFVAGAWASSSSGELTTVTNPASGEPLARVPAVTAEDTRAAIDAASAAFRSWRARTAKERAAALRRWHAEVLDAVEPLARTLTRECGKPLAEARGEIRYAAGFIDWFAAEAVRVYGETIPSPWPNSRIVVTREPVGVSAAITPWNFPAAMITRKCAPALAAGCPVIVKPAPETPLTALGLARLAERAGIPAGVFNVLTGDAATIGGELTASPTVRKLSFTGSTAVGRLLMRQCADTVKRVSLELGGNAPFIVFDDADLDAAVTGAMASKYRNTGQTCVCANRFYVQAGVYDEFAARLAERARRLKVGDGLDDGVEQGPLIAARVLDKVEEHVRDALARGATALCGGGRHELGGTYYQPTVLRDVTADMLVAREETFGPVAPLFRFSNEDEVIAAANATEYGLAAYLYTRDLGRAFRVSEALEYGMVGVNEGVFSTPEAPFGGVKQSGLGREGSRHGIEEYLETKYTLFGLG